MLKTTANKITLLRIVLIPVFLLLCYTGHTNWAFVVYIIACLSDFADGYPEAKRRLAEKRLRELRQEAERAAPRNALKRSRTGKTK